MLNGPTSTENSRGPGTRNSAGMTTRPAKKGTPSHTRLTKKSNGSRLARAAASRTRYTASSTMTEFVKLTARTTTRNIASLARGSIPWSQPAERACSSVNTARSMDAAMPPSEDSIQPMRPSAFGTACVAWLLTWDPARRKVASGRIA